MHADLKSAGDRDSVLQLIDQADVLVEGFRPGVMERLGLGPEETMSRNPRLIYARMTGWGQTGPRANTPGFGSLLSAQAGFCGLTARILASHFLLVREEPPLVFFEKDAERYFDALETYDIGEDLRPLEKLMREQTVETWKTLLSRK